MRIRKHASKLLGSASIFSSPPPPPLPTATGVLCELNCSPWDVMVPNLHHTNPKEEEEEEGGITGNDIKAEEESMTAVVSTAAELTIKEMEEEAQKDLEGRKEKKVKQNKRKEKEIEKSAATAADIITYCKKSDGKGWQCKRPAQPQHSLCHYHLTQLRSYSYNHSQKVLDAPAGTHGRNRPRNASTAVGEAPGASSNFYYYYCGFGPWRGKRRGRCDDSDTVREEECRETSGSGDGYDAPVVHDDLESDGNEEEDQSYWEEKRRLLEKRGRKPVKARSLKSLL